MLFQYLIVFAVVIVAAIVVVRKLVFQTKGGGCHGCNCANKPNEYRKLVKTKQH